MSFRKRVVLAIILSQILIAAVLNVAIYSHRVAARRNFEEEALRTSARCAAHGCSMAMQSGNERTLQEFVDNALGTHGEDCRLVAVEDLQGKTLISTRSKPNKVSFSARPGTDPQAAGSEALRWIAPRESQEVPNDVNLEIVTPIFNDKIRIGSLRMGFSSERLIRWQKRVGLVGIGISLAALLIGCILAFVVDRRLTRSLHDLIGATEQMAAGNLKRRVSITTGDELQLLGDRFNQMAGELDSTIRCLREQEEALEARVRERTSQLRQESQMLSGILSSIGAGLMVIDRSMRVVWANGYIREWFGDVLTRRGRACEKIFGREGGCTDACPGATVLEEGGLHREEIEVERDGERQHFLITCTPIRNKRGRVVRILELVQDITREKKIEQEFVQASKLAAVGELAAGVAHQINNPLAVINAHAERLSELRVNGNLSDESVQHHCEVVNKHVFRCRETIEKLLTFSRWSDQKITATSVARCVDEAIALIREVGSCQDTRIEDQVDPEIPDVLANADGLVQILLNVIMNAIDATAPQGQVRVSARADDGFVTLQIEDDGTGIPAELRERIFDPFFTTKPPGKGTGLGLAVCRRIMEGMDGRIFLRSSGQKGSTFVIKLPLDRGRVQVV